MTRALVLATVLLAATLPAPAQQKSIFDDDWQPPKAAPAKPTLPPPPQPEPEKPATPDTPPATTTDPAPTVVPLPLPATRRPVPAPPEQAAVRKVLKELYGPQLADRTPAGRKSLFAALMAQADKSAAVPTELFVLLAAAHDAAVAAGDLTLVTRAADDLGRQFDVDALAIRAAAAPTVLRPGGAPKDAAADNVRAALALARALATTGDYAGAVKVAQAAGPAAVASGDAALRAQATTAVRDLSALRDAAAKITKDLDKLAAAPDDPAANLAVGRHWCFDLASWPAGLAKLAKGSDAALKALAEKELAAPTAAEQIAALADAWWDVGAKLPEGLARTNVTAHAATLYRRSLPGLSGMRKQLAERRSGDAALTTVAGPRAPAAGPRPPAAGPRAPAAGAGGLTTPAPADGTFKLPATDVVTRQLRAGVYDVTAEGEWSRGGKGPLLPPDGGRMGGENCLMARLPDGKKVSIGAAARLSLGADAAVRFHINDDLTNLRDNRGALTVTVRPVPDVAPPPPDGGPAPFSPVGVWVKADSGTRIAFAADGRVAILGGVDDGTVGTWTPADGGGLVAIFPKKCARLKPDEAGLLTGRATDSKDWTLRRE